MNSGVLESHTATEQWQSFEIRMRRRRVERCVLRASVAIDAGVLEDARGALEEVERLDPHEPAIKPLRARLVAAESRPAGSASEAATIAPSSGVIRHRTPASLPSGPQTPGPRTRQSRFSSPQPFLTHQLPRRLFLLRRSRTLNSWQSPRARDGCFLRRRRSSSRFPERPGGFCSRGTRFRDGNGARRSRGGVRLEAWQRPGHAGVTIDRAGASRTHSGNVL